MKKNKQDQAERLFHAFSEIDPTMIGASRQYRSEASGRKAGRRSRRGH